MAGANSSFHLLAPFTFHAAQLSERGHSHIAPGDVTFKRLCLEMEHFVMELYDGWEIYQSESAQIFSGKTHNSMG